MTCGVADASGKLLHEAEIDLPGPRLPMTLALRPTTPFFTICPSSMIQKCSSVID
ncbi:MAG: hypothetical protein CM15mP74_29000 [Halieaceae bacterium]|nr:MAG: hypothetical protein CM15mP74_29000 [Halieaceae bacterium]